jgi:hypothetical protein
VRIGRPSDKLVAPLVSARILVLREVRAMGEEKPCFPSGQTSDQSAADAFRRQVEELYGGPLPEPQEPPPPAWISLSSAKSEYRRLCDELGGPAEGIEPKVSPSTFEMCCDEYGLARIIPVLLRFTEDKERARRHWPYAAFAINQYVFEIGERSSYRDDEPKPGEIEDLLRNISQSASDLVAGLCRLEKLAERLKDPTAPYRRGHLGWLDAFISQATAGVLSDEVNESPEYRLLVHQGKMAFLKRLSEVEGTTKRAIDRIDRSLLDRERGQSNPALLNFVRRCGSIWTSLTGKNPTGEKLTRRDGGSEDPQFVVFMQGLARVAGAPEPKRNEVLLCLKNITPKTTT